MTNDETFYVVESKLNFSLKRQQRDANIQLCGDLKNIYSRFGQQDLANPRCI